MAVKKIKDIAVKTGEYQDASGATKGRYQNVGALMKSDDGSVFILLEKWFNPAGVSGNADKSSVLLSCFDLRDKDDAGQSSAAPAGRPAAARGGAPAMSDDIPFIRW